MKGREKAYPPEQILRVIQLFLEQPRLPKELMAAQINKEFRNRKPNKLTRQDIYKCIVKGAENHLLMIAPHPELTLAKDLAAEFNLDPTTIHVLPAAQQNSQFVAALAAQRVAAIISRLAASGKKIVSLGIGAGSASLDFCRHLSDLLQHNPPDCRLKLVALSAGCPPQEPKFAPLSFFNMFPDQLIVERVGLFTEPMVTNADFVRIKNSPWVKGAFDAAKDIHIIVTSMGYVKDPEDKFGQLLTQGNVDTTFLKNAGFLGNIQYRPFSSSGAIMGSDSDMRVVTLFELDDLVNDARNKRRDIILIARRCSICGLTKEEVLLPLIQRFCVFTELVTDTATAKALIRLKRAQSA